MARKATPRNMRTKAEQAALEARLEAEAEERAERNKVRLWNILEQAHAIGIDAEFRIHQTRDWIPTSPRRPGVLISYNQHTKRNACFGSVEEYEEVQEVTDFLHTKSEDYEFEAVEYSLTRIREKQEQEKEDKEQQAESGEGCEDRGSVPC
jgi:hypothetical protein